MDLETKAIENLYGNADSVFSSVQFSPHNGEMFVCDYETGKVHRVDLAARKLVTTFDGVIDGYQMKTDDIAFDKNGFMYLSDENGTLNKPVSKIVRLDQDGGNPVVVYEGLAGANGIAFSTDYRGLWVSEYRRSVINYVTLNEASDSAADVQVGMYVGAGRGALDSITLDSEGNVYQSVFDGGRVMIYPNKSKLLGVFSLNDDFPKPQMLSTNVAIKRGSTDAYITVGGENGGYIYHFKALAPGGEQSNGG